MSAQQTQCSCAEEVAGAWKHIDEMIEVGFDIILMASEQAINFSKKWHKCQSCSSMPTVEGTLLQIYGKLVNLLEGSIVTYTSSIHRLPISESDSAKNHPHSSLDRALASSSQPAVFQTGCMNSSPTLAVVCLPSTISLGEYKLGENQSKRVALDLICRVLKNLASVLQQMRHQRVEEANRIDGKIDTIFSQIMILLNRGSKLLSTT